MFAFLITAGGVALILFGVRFLRKGLDRLFGATLADWMQRLAGRRTRAFFSGMAIALMAPSSTTISILTVQAVRLGHLGARQMLALVFGADITLTAMVVFISLGFEQYAPILLLFGVVLFHYTRSQRSRGIGQTAIGLGIILMGIATMKGAVAGVEPNGDFARIVAILQSYPFGIALLAVAMAVVFQSSTTAIAMAIGLTAANVVSLTAAIAVVAGANVGIAITTLMIGWPGVESRRLGYGSLIAKTTTALLVLLALPWITQLVESVRAADTIDRKIALAHTGFNVLQALLFLPAIPLLVRVLRWLVPDPPPQQRDVFGTQYINRVVLDEPDLALGQSMREILRVSDLVRHMLDDLWQALKKRNADLAKQVQERDDRVDLLDNEIKAFLSQLSGREGDGAISAEAMRQLRYLTELETIGDVIDKNLGQLVLKSVRENVYFSDEGWGELNEFYRMVAENILIAETAFTTRDRVLARRLIRHKEHLSETERRMRDQHFERLRSGMEQSHESSSVHLDILTYLKQINRCVTHVAYTLSDRNNSNHRE